MTSIIQPILGHRKGFWCSRRCCCCCCFFLFPIPVTEACSQLEKPGQHGPPSLKGATSQTVGPAGDWCEKDSHTSPEGLSSSHHHRCSFLHKLSPIHCDGKQLEELQCALLSAECRWGPDLMSRNMMKGFFQLCLQQLLYGFSVSSRVEAELGRLCSVLYLWINEQMNH